MKGLPKWVRRVRTLVTGLTFVTICSFAVDAGANAYTAAYENDRAKAYGTFQSELKSYAKGGTTVTYKSTSRTTSTLNARTVVGRCSILLKKEHSYLDSYFGTVAPYKFTEVRVKINGSTSIIDVTDRGGFTAFTKLNPTRREVEKYLKTHDTFFRCFPPSHSG